MTEHAMAKNSTPHKFASAGRRPCSRRDGAEAVSSDTTTSPSESNKNAQRRPNAGAIAPYKNADDPAPRYTTKNDARKATCMPRPWATDIWPPTRAAMAFSVPLAVHAPKPFTKAQPYNVA